MCTECGNACVNKLNESGNEFLSRMSNECVTNECVMNVWNECGNACVTRLNECGNKCVDECVQCLCVRV